MTKSEELGQLPIPKLLWQQSAPAAVGILVMSIYGIVDTIFVGQYVGPIAIAAITVVLPITFLISSVGMAIGVGGGSIISRALGRSDKAYAERTFGNQVVLVTIFSLLVVGLSLIFQKPFLQLFGAQGDILPAAQSYFQILLPSIPFLAWAMMSNNIIRSEGEPRIAMMVMLIPAVINLILDPIFIIWMDMGLEGAALATSLSYVASASFTILFFLYGRSELRIKWPNLSLHPPIVKEIFSLGIITLARQGTVALLAIVLNNTLFQFGGELAVSIYGIVQRLGMFANFPVLGITQGFIPIAGYNYGAKFWSRVRSVIRLALTRGTLIALCIFAGIMLFTEEIVRLFTYDEELINLATPALRIVFAATPTILMQLLGPAYFQALGRARPALFLTLTKQGFCLIPLILILPHWLGLNGVWVAFPIADLLAAGICYFYLQKALGDLPK